MYIDKIILLIFCLQIYRIKGQAPTIYRIIEEDKKIFMHNGSPIILRPGGTVTLLCNGYNTRWYRRSFSDFSYLQAKPLDLNDGVERVNSNELRLQVDRGFGVKFEHSSIYECHSSGEVSSIRLYVYTIKSVVNATLCFAKKTKKSSQSECPQLNLALDPRTENNDKEEVALSAICSFEENNEVTSKNPIKTSELACGCSVGQSSVARGANISWSGGRLHDKPEWYEFREELQNESGSEKILQNAPTKWGYLRLKQTKDLDQSVLGRYTCSCNMYQGQSVKADVYLHSPPIVFMDLLEQPLPSSIRAKKNDKFEFPCRYMAFPSINRIIWKRDNVSLDIPTVGIDEIPPGNPRIYALHDQTSGNLSLFISELIYNDKAIYKCQIENKYGSNCLEIALRIKDPLGWLWPALGIAIEILILLIIIGWYEITKSKRKQENNESSEKNAAKNETIATTTAAAGQQESLLKSKDVDDDNNPDQTSSVRA